MISNGSWSALAFYNVRLLILRSGLLAQLHITLSKSCSWLDALNAVCVADQAARVASAPICMLLSGGYARGSHAVISKSIAPAVAEACAARRLNVA